MSVVAAACCNRDVGGWLWSVLMEPGRGGWNRWPIGSGSTPNGYAVDSGVWMVSTVLVGRLRQPRWCAAAASGGSVPVPPNTAARGWLGSIAAWGGIVRRCMGAGQQVVGPRRTVRARAPGLLMRVPPLQDCPVANLFVRAPQKKPLSQRVRRCGCGITAERDLVPTGWTCKRPTMVG